MISLRCSSCVCVCVCVFVCVRVCVCVCDLASVLAWECTHTYMRQSIHVRVWVWLWTLTSAMAHTRVHGHLFDEKFLRRSSLEAREAKLFLRALQFARNTCNLLWYICNMSIMFWKIPSKVLSLSHPSHVHTARGEGLFFLSPLQFARNACDLLHTFTGCFRKLELPHCYFLRSNFAHEHTCLRLIRGNWPISVHMRTLQFPHFESQCPRTRNAHLRQLTCKWTETDLHFN